MLEKTCLLWPDYCTIYAYMYQHHVQPHIELVYVNCYQLQILTLKELGSLLEDYLTFYAKVYLLMQHFVV